jgi:hypothetical protein
LLKKIAWSRQKPAERADQRDDAAVATWREETLPDLKKTMVAKFTGQGRKRD